MLWKVSFRIILIYSFLELLPIVAPLIFSIFFVVFLSYERPDLFEKSTFILFLIYCEFFEVDSRFILGKTR